MNEVKVDIKKVVVLIATILLVVLGIVGIVTFISVSLSPDAGRGLAAFLEVAIAGGVLGAMAENGCFKD